MKITLKNFKHAAFASEETLCFEASVYIDGKKIAKANNDGKGGNTFIYPEQGRRDELNQILDRAKAGLLERTDYAGFAGLEWLVDEVANAIVDYKQLKSHFDKGAVFEDNGETRTWGYKKKITGLPNEAALRQKVRESIKDKYPNAKILEPNPNVNTIEV